MPVTIKQKSKTRKSREADMISDLENMDVLIENSHYERADSEFGNSIRRPESPSYDALVDHNSNITHTLIQEKMRFGDLQETVKAQVKLILARKRIV